MIVSMCGQKGGAGKTTLAVALASEWHRRGHRVLLVDLDPQGTATTWGDVAAEVGVEGPTVIGMGDSVATQLPSVAKAYDLVVVDCPPRAGKRTSGALLVSNLAILPCGPSPADLWALTEALEVVEQVRAIRPELDVRIAMNAVVSSSTLGGDVAAELAELPIEVMRSIIRARVAHARSLAHGQGVTITEPGSVAALEVGRWVDEVEEILDLKESAA